MPDQLLKPRHVSSRVAMLCILCWFAWGCDQVSKPVTNLVTTSSGKLQGAYTGEDQRVRVFKGVPYARPPVGEYRWRMPQPLEATSSIHDATSYAPACTQLQSPGFYGRGKIVQSEDCLYLNVWTSARTADAAQPVMVWIHGGAFVVGSGSHPITNGEQFARDGVVLVTINYRLGMMGFFAHPALSEESPKGVSGNYGLLDQVAALQWVQDNIKAFGGDPSNVTIFGESAGSMSVCYMASTPLARGLFQRAIGQSGGCFGKHTSLTDSAVVSSDAAISEQELGGSGHDIGMQLASALGVPGKGAAALQQLRAVPAEIILMDIKAAGVFAPWRSIFIDGYVFPDQIRVLHEQKQANPVDVIVGSTTDEGTTLWMQLQEVSMDAWESGIAETTGSHADRFIELYREDARRSTKTATQLVMSDRVFAWEMRTWARLSEAADRTNTYLYVFEHAPPVEEFGRTLGAYHAAEIAYVFGNGNSLWNAEDQQVSLLTHAYWVNFAKTGDPNGANLPIWPAYNQQNETALIINSTPQQVVDYRGNKLDAHEDYMKFTGKKALRNLQSQR